MKKWQLIILITLLVMICGVVSQPSQMQSRVRNQSSFSDKTGDQSEHRRWLQTRVEQQLREQFDHTQTRQSKVLNDLPQSLSPVISSQLADRVSADRLINSPSPDLALATNSNIRINDPQQETGARVQNGTASAVSGDNIVVAFNDIGTLNAGISYSNDGGINWQQTRIPTLTGGRNLGSGVVAARGNNFYYTGVAITSSGGAVIIFSQSKDKGQNWSAPIIVNSINRAIVQDKPWIAVDDNPGPTLGNIYICWTEFGPGLRSGIVCANSTDNGQTFTTSLPITVAANFVLQGANVVVGESGQVYVTWGDSTLFGISIARSDDAGRSFSLPQVAVSLSTYQLIGPLLNSHFSSNGLPSVAVDRSTGANRGTIYIVFSAPSNTDRRDRSDVYLVTSKDGGKNWSAPRKINDDSSITDQFLPSVAVAIDGTAAVMWYDRRNDGINNGLLDVYATVSSDGGSTFTANSRVTTSNWLLLTTPPNIRANYHGDYNQMSALTDRAGFFFNWGDDRNGLDADVYAATISVDSLKNAKPSLIFSPITPSQTLLAGQGVQYRLRLSGENSINSNLEFSASSDSNGIKASFDKRGLANGDLLVLVRTDESVTAGSHPLIISANNGDQIISITLRLNVLPGGQFSRLPIKVATSVGRSIQSAGALDSNGAVNTIWADDVEGNFRIFYARSNDGVNFTTPLEISQSNRVNFNVNLVVDEADNIHAVWQECLNGACDIKYARSLDKGASFEKPLKVSTGIDFGEFPAIAVNPKGEVVISWDGVRSSSIVRFEIFTAKSIDNGARFSLPVTIASDVVRNLFTTDLVSDGAGRTYLAYESCIDGNCQIETKQSTDGFDTFTDGATASKDLFFAIKPVLSAPGNGVLHVAMTVALDDGDSRFEIFTSSSNDGGNSFTKPKNISNTTDVSNNPTIVANNDQILVAWIDNSTGNFDILMSRSRDGGQTFSKAVNLTSNNTISQEPELFQDKNGSIQLVYTDEMDGNDEIYTFRLDGPSAVTTINSIAPENGPPGANVTIRGNNLNLATAVTINNQPAEFFLNSAAELAVIVPVGARSGQFVITTSSGTVNTSAFTVTSAISVGPSNLEFGQIGVGQVIADQEVLISNISNSPLKLTGISINSDDFRLINAPAVPVQIAVNQVLKLNVRYQPKQAGSSQAQLKITSSDSTSPNTMINLTGQATPAVLTLQGPNGGEKLRAGEDFTINWSVDSSAEPVSFDLVFSNDGGQTFPTIIVQNLDANARSFTWKVVTLKTKLARVAVVMRTANGAVFMNGSQSNFKIKVKK